MKVLQNQQSLLERPQTIQIIDETVLWKNMNLISDNLPDHDVEVMPGLKWGFCYQLYTPAFWKLQYLMNAYSEEIDAHRLSDDIIEEIILCLLGGYGIPSEMGLTAFERLKNRGLIYKNVGFDTLFDALKEPFEINGRLVKYRFSFQKAKYIHDFLGRNDLLDIPQKEDLKLRKWLINLKGIGPKTASWITRNWLRSERVAILDIHILRAGMITGFFKRDINIEKDYYDLEHNYLNFCHYLEVRPSDMDAIIWSYMKKNNKLALNILSSTS